MVGLLESSTSPKEAPLWTIVPHKKRCVLGPKPPRLEAAFDGGRITSDSGLVWLSKMDEELGLCEAISECVRSGGRGAGSIRSSRWLGSGSSDSLRLRGSERLRHPARRPLLKAACGSLPRAEQTSPAADDLPPGERGHEKLVRRIAEVLFELYLKEREKDGAPGRVLLDFDATADPATAIRRPVTTAITASTCTIPSSSSTADGASRHGAASGGEHPRLQLGGGATQAHRLAIARKMAGCGHRDKGRCGLRRTRLYNYCEEEGVTYTIGLITNPRLEAMAQDLLAEALELHEADRTKNEAPLGRSLPGRKLGEEAQGRLQGGGDGAGDQHALCRNHQDRRAEGPLRVLCQARRRGELDQGLKLHVKADRLSCHRFIATIRLLLHAVAYWLLDTLRRKLVASGARRMQLDTLRVRLLKVGGRIGSFGRRSVCTSHRAILDRAYGTLSIRPSEAFMNNSG